MKKKSKFCFSYTAIIWIALLVIGLLITNRCSKSLDQFSSPADLKNMIPSSLEMGDIVSYNIDSYLVRPVDEYNPNKFTGLYRTVTTLMKTYDVYNVQMGGKYIRIMVCSDDAKAALANFEDGKGKTAIPVIGRVARYTAPKAGWYKLIDKFDMDSVVSDYVIKESTPKDLENIRGIGIVCIAVALFGIYKSIAIFRFEA